MVILPVVGDGRELDFFVGFFDGGIIEEMSHRVKKMAACEENEWVPKQ